ncbi:hypothetical protein P5F55_12890 [Clostridium perfringens]|nr:hypothetical protein [Clostridium perfringens]
MLYELDKFKFDTWIFELSVSAFTLIVYMLEDISPSVNTIDVIL